MELQLVSFELAKKLKEVGFDLIINQFKGISYYNYLGTLRGDSLMAVKHRNSESDIYNNLAAPTLELSKMWFREKHQLEIDVYPNAMGWQVNIDKTNGTHVQIVEEYNDRNKYEEALEQGLLKACELIK